MCSTLGGEFTAARLAARPIRPDSKFPPLPGISVYQSSVSVSGAAQLVTTVKGKQTYYEISVQSIGPDQGSRNKFYPFAGKNLLGDIV